MPITNYNEIEKFLNLEEGTLSKASSSEEEVNITIPELKVFKPEDFKKYDENRYKEGQDSANNWMLEKAIKEARAEEGLDFEGKTVPNLVKSIKAKYQGEASKGSDERVSELETDISKLKSNIGELQEQLTEKDTTIATIQEEFRNKENMKFINEDILGNIPKKGLPYEKGDAMVIFKSEIESKRTPEGVIQHFKNGELLKNSTTLDPMSTKEVAAMVFKDRIKSPEGGTGAGDSGKEGKLTVDQYTEHQVKKGVTVNSPEFNKGLQEGLKKGNITLE